MLKYLRQKVQERKLEKMMLNQDTKSPSYADIDKNQDHTQQLKQIANQQSERKKKFASKNKRRVTFYLIYEFISVVCQSLISIYACAVYIVSLYMSSDTDDPTFNQIEFSTAILILLDLVNGLFLAPSKKKYFLNILNIIDVMTVIPIIIEQFIESQVANLSFARIWRFVRFLRFFRIYKILRKINTNDIKSISNTDPVDVKRKLFTIFIQFLALVFISASVIFTLNKNFPDTFAIYISTGQDLTFDIALYFVLITITTVGYGDVVPNSTLSRICIGLFFIAAVVFFTMQTSEISDLIKQGNNYSKPFKRKSNRHVILTAQSFNDLKLLRFLTEFFHKDHDLAENMKVVIVSKDKPSNDVQQVIAMYEEQTYLIVGSIFNEQTLQKADILNAEAAFILSNQYDNHSIKADSFSVLASKMMREFNKNMQINVQLINKDYLIHSWCNWDNVYSIDEFKLGIIAANAYNPGFCPIILNLLRSSGKISSSNKNGLWLVEYTHGLEHEIYCIKIPSKYVNQIFEFVVKIGFNGKGILIFGIRRKKPRCPFDFYEILINPVKYRIQKGDEALVLATDFTHAQRFDEDDGKDLDPYDREISGQQLNELKDLQFIKNFDFRNPEPLHKTDDHFLMWRDDLSYLKDHILIFGDIEAMPTLIECLRNFTNNYICYVSDKLELEKWNKIKNRYSNVVYFEASFSDKNELARTGIQNSRHVILLSWMLQNSNHPDSGMLQIIRIIDEHFPDVQYTLELVDENNLKYLNKKNNSMKDTNLPFICNTKYASGSVFFSSILDAIIAQSYFNETLFEVLDKLIFGGTVENESKVEENCKLNMILIDSTIGGKTTFKGFFEACINNEGSPIIPIGIQRQPNSLILGNQQPYIITNPDKNCLLMEGDRVYVLGENAETKKKRQQEYKKGYQDQRDQSQMKKQLIQLSDSFSNLDEQYLKKMDDDVMLSLIKKELEKSEIERKKLQQQQAKLRQEKLKLSFQSTIKSVLKNKELRNIMSLTGGVASQIPKTQAATNPQNQIKVNSEEHKIMVQKEDITYDSINNDLGQGHQADKIIFSELKSPMPDQVNNSMNSQGQDFLRIKDQATPQIERRLPLTQKMNYLKANFQTVDQDQSIRDSEKISVIRQSEDQSMIEDMRELIDTGKKQSSVLKIAEQEKQDRINDHIRDARISDLSLEEEQS
ncbi:cation channel family protein [Stylonychia lemnae]|uniref:Cation channel family protein n=1 Tax=Stylonychia lemnae TaxID=5949 RepID=A0A078AX97_STYLE|nr:cation channel family protein [Stylonychia lemnae]|eukprot:CDW86696.1 cation channel family protein [Stylonychia lemnae]